jgi:hypothetical protein
MPSYLKDHGSQLLKNGYRIVPIRPGQKAPGISGWQNSRADDTTIDQWLAQMPAAGVGVVAEDTPAIDIDCRDKDVSYKLIKWVETNIGKAPIRIGNKPKALMVFRADEPFGKIRSHEYEDCIGNRHAVEVLGKGQQFVAFAIHPDTKKPYDWPRRSILDTPHDELPVLTREMAQEFVAYFESIVPADWELARKGVSVTHGEDDDLLTLRPKLGAGVDALAGWLDSIDPDCDHDQWVKTGMAIHHETDGSPEGLALWDRWSSGGGKYVHGECGRRWRSFGRNASAQPVTAQYIEGKAKKVERAERKKGLVDKLLQDLIFVQVSGSACVIREDEVQDGIDLYGVEDLTKEFANQMIPITSENAKGEEKIDMVNPVKLWLAHPERRTARGLVFLPEGQKIGYYNLWRGWSCEAEEGDVSPFLDYVHVVVANGDENHARWILGWAAQIIQQPMTKIGVALVLKGLKGTGKSKFGELLGGLCPHHHKVISRQEQLVGQFNRHLEDCLILQAEEAFWAGSKSAEGALKDLVTGQRILIERKGVDSYMTPNFTRLLFTSNEEWVVPATADERRWAVFEVSNKHKQDYDYFEALQNWYDRGGKKAVLHYLRTFDLSTVNIRQAPKTEALQQQQLKGADCVSRWLYEALMSGEIRDRASGAAVEFGEVEVGKNLIYDSYRGSQQRLWEMKSDGQFWQALRRYDDIFLHSRQKRAAGARYRVCDLATLAEARKTFSESHQLVVDWPDPICNEEL